MLLPHMFGETPWNRTKQTLVKSQIPKPIGLRLILLSEVKYWGKRFIL